MLISQDKELARMVILTDVTQRLQMEKALQQKSAHLEKLNRTLKSMLDQRGIEKQVIEESIYNQLQKFVEPYLEKMRVFGKEPRAAEQAKIIQANLKKLVFGRSQGLSAAYLDLTPAEVGVADLIRQGLASKTIAAKLHISHSTVAIHRNNIRRKLGLLHAKTNLQTYLNSLV
jgi:DNA-binding NarL/FixJ family response regulator